MKYEADMMDYRRDGYKEGVAEGEARGEAKGEAKGRAEGEAKGRAERDREIMLMMVEKGMENESIMEFLPFTEEQINCVREENGSRKYQP